MYILQKRLQGFYAAKLNKKKRKRKLIQVDKSKI